MKKIASFLLMFCLFCSSSVASDWKSPADIAVSMSPGAIVSLENKQDKSAQDVYMLTVIYYREYQRLQLKKLLRDHEKTLSGTPEVRLLAGIVLLGEHRYADSRQVLNGVLNAYPDFHPAAIVLAHLDYLQKDFERAYRGARLLIEKKRELSRFHFAVSLMIAAGAKGILTPKNLIQGIPAYFEVNGYLREAQKQMPDSAEVLYALGSYRLLTPAIAGGDLDSAIVLLERSRQLAPLMPAVHVRLAQAYRAKGLAVLAQQFLARARRLDPQDELLQDDLSGQKAFLDVP